MAVSLAISEIFSFEEWPDLEIWVFGSSRSLKMPRFDRPCTTFYWSAIVAIDLMILCYGAVKLIIIYYIGLCNVCMYSVLVLMTSLLGSEVK